MEWVEKNPMSAECEECRNENSEKMTQENWEQRLWACIQDGTEEQYNKLWDEHPDLADHMMKEFYEVAANNMLHFTEADRQAGLERLKARIREERGESMFKE